MLVQRNTTVLKNKLCNVLCKMYFPCFAREKWSDHDFENYSEIRHVTRIRKMWVQSQILRQCNGLKSGRHRVPKLPPLSVKHVCPISQKTNHPIMVPKIVLKSVLWRGSEAAHFFCIFQLLCFSLHTSPGNSQIGGSTSLQLVMKEIKMMAPPSMMFLGWVDHPPLQALPSCSSKHLIQNWQC